MKKHYIFKFVLLLIPVSAFTLLSFSSGNSAALSGSPGDGGNTCAQCHGTASASNITITTNIPDTGYAFDTEYDVIITNSSGGSKNGFNLTAEKDSDNGKVGTFISTGGDTQTASGNSRIIHTSSGNGQSSWAFKWRSPSSDLGKVTFYAASVSGNGNFNSGGDQVFTGKSISTPSLSTKSFNTLAFDMYPNPSKSNVTIDLPSAASKAKVEFYDYLGRLALSTTISAGNNKVNVNELSTGMYILKVSADDKIGTKKFIKQ